MNDPIGNRPITHADLPAVIEMIQAREDRAAAEAAANAAAAAAAPATEALPTVEELQAKADEIRRENARLKEMDRVERSGAISKGELQYAKSLRFP